MKQNARCKLACYPGSLPIAQAKLQPINKLHEFDDVIITCIHSFQDAADYYRQCSALALLPAICAPTLIIHTQDNGGHAGFISGLLLKLEMWLEQAF
ncbi:MAG: hypothetical protein ACSLEM_01105 [Candidatus Malihini olakiniferum]